MAIRKFSIDNPNFKHGMSYSRTYKIWMGIKRRCLYKKHNRYHIYGGRGITICHQWMKFENFISEMGECPPGYQIDRINNDGNYEPSNCRWVTPKTNSRNTRRTVLLTHDGLTKSLIEWSEYLKISYDCLGKRYLMGWDVNKILTTPKMNRSEVGRIAVNKRWKKGMIQ